MIYKIEQEPNEEIASAISNYSSSPTKFSITNNSTGQYNIYKHHLINGEINNNKNVNSNQQDDIELIVSVYLFHHLYLLNHFVYIYIFVL